MFNCQVSTYSNLYVVLTIMFSLGTHSVDFLYLQYFIGEVTGFSESMLYFDLYPYLFLGAQDSVAVESSEQSTSSKHN